MCSSDLDENVFHPPLQNFYAVFELARGGAVDATVYASEDKRIGNRWWVEVPTDTQTANYFTIGEPVYRDGSWWFPFRIRVFGAVLDPVSAWSLQISMPPLDFNNRWHPEIATELSPDVFEIPVYFPPERAVSRSGYNSTVPAAAGRIVSYHPAVDTYTIIADFDGSAVATTWATNPYINIANDNEPLFWLPMRLVGDNSASPPDFSNYTAVINGSDVKLAYYRVSYIQPVTNDVLQQPVDWWAKSAQIGIDGQSILRTRGLFIQALTKGGSVNAGHTMLSTDFKFGILNALATSDWKDWAMQIVDTNDEQGSPNTAEVFNKGTNQVTSTTNSGQPLRQRLYDGANMNWNVYNGAAVWEDADDPGDGNSLTGDEPLDTLAMSAATRGEFLSWMLFGFVANRAQHLLLASAKAVVRMTGDRRRVGR